MSDLPTYNVWITSNGTPRSNTSFGNTPNSEFTMDMQWPKFPDTVAVMMKLTSFKLQTPSTEETRGGWFPLDGTVDVPETSIGMLGIIHDDTEPPAFTSLSGMNLLKNWWIEGDTPIGMFDASDSGNLQSQWTLITPPLASSTLTFTVRDAGNPERYLVNRDESGALVPLNDWAACVSFKSLSRSDIEQYYPWQKMNYELIFSYPQTLPTPPTSVMSEYNLSTSNPSLSNPWIALNKGGISNRFWQSSRLSFPVNNTTVADVYLEADVYFSISDPEDASPSVAFSGLTPEYTTASVAALAGTDGVVDFVLSEQDQGYENLYLWIKVVGGGAIPAGVNTTFDSIAPPDQRGGNGGALGNFNFQYYGSPV